MPMHDVAPRAVSIADAIDAISCTINFAVSFFVIVWLNLVVNTPCHLERSREISF
jgi:hypothetical protein